MLISIRYGKIQALQGLNFEKFGLIEHGLVKILIFFLQNFKKRQNHKKIKNNFFLGRVENLKKNKNNWVEWKIKK